VTKIAESEQKKEDWMNSKWRPMMGWMYMAVCAADFMVFPILWSVLQSVSHGQVTSQWQPLTLQGAGLFHVAMGAVLGIAAYGRTKEKLNGAESGGLSSGFGPGSGTTYVPPGQGNVQVSNQQPNNMNIAGGGFQSPVTNNSFGGGFQSPATNNSFGGGFNNTPLPMAPAAAAGIGSSFNPSPLSSPAVPVNSKGQKVIPQNDQPAL